jgi:hypothetical protein
VTFCPVRCDATIIPRVTLQQPAEKGERSRLCERSEAIQTTFPEERSRFRSVRDRFMNCFVALLLAMTAEKTFSAAC